MSLKDILLDLENLDIHQIKTLNLEFFHVLV